MSATEETPKLTRGQTAVLVAAAVPMVGTGVAGGWGTYSNVVAEFGRSATALGVVAGGEGVTLVLALVMVGLTMLGQSAPLAVRLGLWFAPLVAAGTGLVVAETATEAVVYGMTPMAMCASAEGMGLLARRIVVYRTGVDMEARRRNAETVQLLAYHRSRANNHPSKRARWLSERASWRLARRVGVGDEQLGATLVEVQRERLSEGADAALADMLGGPARPALPSAPEQDGRNDRRALPPLPTVPAGTRTLPIVARPAPVVPDHVPAAWLDTPEGTTLLPITTRPQQTLAEVLDEIGWYVPDAVRLAPQPKALPPGRSKALAKNEAKPRTVSAKVDAPAPGDEEQLLAQARKDFPTGAGVKALKDRYRIGQAKAQWVRDQLNDETTIRVARDYQEADHG